MYIGYKANIIMPLAPDNSVVLVYSDDNSISIHYTYKYLYNYNIEVLTKILSDELPFDLINSISKYCF
jgi:hypothetical protein